MVRAESACESGVCGLARAEKRRVLAHVVSRDTVLESELWRAVVVDGRVVVWASRRGPATCDCAWLLRMPIVATMRGYRSLA